MMQKLEAEITQRRCDLGQNPSHKKKELAHEEDLFEET